MSSLQTVPTLKKYGLQKRSGTKKHASALSSSSSSALSFFNTDLEDEEDEDDQQSSKKGEKNLNSRAQIRNHLNLQRSNHKLMQASSNTIPTLTAEEAKIFDYDGSYDDYKELEKDKFGKSMNLLGKDEPVRLIVSSASDPSVSLPLCPHRNQDILTRFKPRHLFVRKKKIGSMNGSLLLSSPSHPSSLSSLPPSLTSAVSRILLKERQKEDAAYGDKPKFITSEYKRKLMEDQKWEMEDKLADALEERTGVAARGMHGFYSNLLTKNIAMGGDVTTSAVSAYTAGSRRQQKHLGEEDGERGGGEGAGEREERAAQGTGEAEERQRKRPIESERRNVEESSEREQEAEKRRKVEPEMQQMAPPIAASEGSLMPTHTPAPPFPTPTPEPAPVASKETLILSAKERYLQRKLQQQQAASEG